METQQTQQTQQTKQWYKSKTMWFNLGIAICGAIMGLLADGSFKIMVGEYYPYILTFVTLGNVILRTITTTPVSFKPKV